MIGLPIFTETDLSDWIDTRSLSRGRAYFHEGAIEQPTHGPAADTVTLAALCHGSRPMPYRVQAIIKHSATLLRQELDELKADKVAAKFGLTTTGEWGNFASGKVGVEASCKVMLK